MALSTHHPRRTLGESEKRVVAARQQWRCSECLELLPAAFQVDHTVPLHLGGPDEQANCTAMCPNCHAAKTQREAINRYQNSHATITTYEDRVDICLANGMLQCAECWRIRPESECHALCPAIEVPRARHAALANNLAKFAYTRS